MFALALPPQFVCRPRSGDRFRHYRATTIKGKEEEDDTGDDSDGRFRKHGTWIRATARTRLHEYHEGVPRRRFAQRLRPFGRGVKGVRTGRRWQHHRLHHAWL